VHFTYQFYGKLAAAIGQIQLTASISMASPGHVVVEQDVELALVSTAFKSRQQFLN
jgi:hypothetical protein